MLSMPLTTLIFHSSLTCIPAHGIPSHSNSIHLLNAIYIMWVTVIPGSFKSGTDPMRVSNTTLQVNSQLCCVSK